jgi:hypothetical protein
MTTKAPNLRRKAWGRKRYCWRRCPYSTNDVSERIPEGERTDHTTTSGYMTLDSRGSRWGWVCEDPNCSYFLGTASTAIEIPVNKTTISGGQHYIITQEMHEVPLCSGVQFWEY